MAKIRIGKTELQVEQNGFGALPIQRISTQAAVDLLRQAQAGGMTYFDTARGYTDSEEKLGKAFAGRWAELVIATKTPAKSASEFWSDLDTSLRLLKTDHIDVFQFHNPPFCPKPGDASGLYDAMLAAKQAGKIRYIGITNHRLHVAQAAIESGLYDTLQFPFSYLGTEQESALVQACQQRGVGFIAMKALSGGLITHSAAACAWVTQYHNVLPIWGIQKEWELNEFLSYIKHPPTLSAEMLQIISADRQELQGEFCRGCGYCMPCPQGIAISTCARASLLLRRSPAESLLSERGQQMMRQIADCVECGQCSAQCPYGLDTPALLKRNYQDYQEVLAGKPL